MIKVGIYGPAQLDDAVRKQLLRLLLRHPDVDLRGVASPAGNARPIAELHPVYAGETALKLERVLDVSGLDVLFVIDEENLSDEMWQKYVSDSEFRLIILGNAPLYRNGKSADVVYGLPEYTRKALVRGARAAVSPSPGAILLELALLPLAKNMLLNAPVDITVSGGIDEASVAEAGMLLEKVQISAKTQFNVSASAAAPYERMDLHAEMETPIAREEIVRLYTNAYDDHSFVHIIPGSGPVDEDLRGSNKCLLRIDCRDGRLIIDASMDALTKGCTGNAVHIMNLLFGLLERTGLSI